MGRSTKAICGRVSASVEELAALANPLEQAITDETTRAVANDADVYDETVSDIDDLKVAVETFVESGANDVGVGKFLAMRLGRYGYAAEGLVWHGMRSLSNYSHALEHLAKHVVYLKRLAAAVKDLEINARPVSTGEVEAFAKQAGVTLAPDYVEYLTQYGVISYGSLETYGLGVPETSHLNLITATKSLTSVKPLPPDCVPLNDIMDGYYYLYDNKHRVVVEWSAITGKVKPTSGTLDSFLAERIER